MVPFALDRVHGRAASAFLVFEVGWTPHQASLGFAKILPGGGYWCIIAFMTESAVFTIDVVKDIGNPNRFRWNIYENKRVRDKSLYSFATKREAQSDADKFVRKLNAIWPASKE
jgi:hypothetical protein